MRSLTVMTEAGIATSTAWWAHVRIEGRSVVLSSSHDDGWPDHSLVVAQLASVSAARALFDIIKERRAVGARKFDAAAWPGLVSRYNSDDSAGGGGS